MALHSYGKEAATHYSAYRPPLHREILSRALGERRFDQALDYGCGTGQSSIALLSYAAHVTAIDNSAEMLSAARKHDRVSYNLGSEEQLAVENQSVALVTMAGVLPYLNLPPFVSELRRICRSEAVLLPYDFKIVLQPLMDLFYPNDTITSSPYDHSKNLSGIQGIVLHSCSETNCYFKLSTDEAISLILSNEKRFEQLSDQFVASPNLKEAMRCVIDESDFDGHLSAQLYWSEHRFDDN